MSKSREIILRSLKEATNIPSSLKSAPGDIDKKIDSQLMSMRLKERVSIIKLFEKELISVSTEFYRAENYEKGAGIVRKILKEEGDVKICFSDGRLCDVISRILKIEAGEIEIVKTAEITSNRKEKLASISFSVAEASFGIAETGSLCFFYDNTGTTLSFFLSEVVIALVREKTIVHDQFELFDRISQENLKNMVFVSGPSRTADIEKILILGAHGPRRFVVLMMDED